MSRAEIIEAVRTDVALFEMADRGLLEVRGTDRVRWLDGMISGDVLALDRASPGAGCHALFLTNRGAIIADLHVARFEDAFLLESLRSAIPKIRASLERFIIADDVELLDRTDDFVTFGLEGPAAPGLLEKALDEEALELGSEQWTRGRIADRDVLVAAFGFSGEQAYQLRFAPEDRNPVEDALAGAAGTDGLVRGDPASLEVLRIEAGIPALGAELDEDVLPPEARLEQTIAINKGCYVGQEIVARLRARGQVNHLLVGVRLEARDLPEVGTALSIGERASGELTSVTESPGQGRIALAYVRREHAEPGTRLDFEGGQAIVATLPFDPRVGAPPLRERSGAR
jgi:folate-binding protein YgfZ